MTENCNGHNYCELKPNFVSALRKTYWEDLTGLPNFFSSGFSARATIEINGQKLFCGLLPSKYNTGLRSFFNHPATIMVYDSSEARKWRWTPVYVFRAEEVWNAPIYDSDAV